MGGMSTAMWSARIEAWQRFLVGLRHDKIPLDEVDAREAYLTGFRDGWRRR
jgi:hypothetical protein